MQPLSHRPHWSPKETNETNNALVCLIDTLRLTLPICPFFCRLWSGSSGSRSSRVFHMSMCPATLSSSSLGDPEEFPNQMRYVIPPACSGSALGSPPTRLFLKNHQREVPMRHPNQVPESPQLAPFDVKERRLYFELPPDFQATHYSKPMTTGEDGIVDQAVN